MFEKNFIKVQVKEDKEGREYYTVNGNTSSTDLVHICTSLLANTIYRCVPAADVAKFVDSVAEEIRQKITGDKVYDKFPKK